MGRVALREMCYAYFTSLTTSQFELYIFFQKSLDPIMVPSSFKQKQKLFCSKCNTDLSPQHVLNKYFKFDMTIKGWILGKLNSCEEDYVHPVPPSE